MNAIGQKILVTLEKFLSGKSKLLNIINRIFFYGLLPRLLMANEVAPIQSNDPEPHNFFIFKERVQFSARFFAIDQSYSVQLVDNVFSNHRKSITDDLHD